MIFSFFARWPRRSVFRSALKWTWLSFLCLFVFYILYGISLSHIETQVFPERLEVNHPSPFYDYSGVMNVHTNISSGTGDLNKVIEDAQSENLNFIFLTDLSALKHRKEREGYHDQLLIFIDGEYPYLNVNLLNYDARWPGSFLSVAHSQSLFTDYLTRELKEDHMGVFVLAHPFKSHYEWTGSYPIGLDGVEVINLSSLWQGIWKRKIDFLKILFSSPFNFRLAMIHLLSLPEKEIQLWDQLNQKQKTIGFAGSDAKGRIRFFYFTIKLPSYQSVFRLLKTHILLKTELTGSALRDRKKISAAVRKGQFFFSFDFLENPKGFVSYMKEDGRVHLFGSELKWRPSLRLFVTLPQTPLVPFKTVLYKDGSPLFTFWNKVKINSLLSSPGVYRLVVFLQFPSFFWIKKKWVPWILTNSFYVKP